SLADFLAGHRIPQAKAPIVRLPESKAREEQAQRRCYIAAFPVVAGTDFAAAMKQVGNRVELVGKIVAVKQGVGKRGRGRGRPFVFVNFGNWLGNIVKVTIWYEG